MCPQPPTVWAEGAAAHTMLVMLQLGAQAAAGDLEHQSGTPAAPLSCCKVQTILAKGQAPQRKTWCCSLPLAQHFKLLLSGYVQQD